ncbi:sensor histidine kinase [Sphingomonas pokkalii]|uniref:histidine kinase n=1 Tax=Sphingomonas pokkalii TaxID=2175090 RepID=A0A2U0SG53_9SPHN|nr:PAS domain-containing sensor histidine kinase [Sphingomonas pokkalii]PVX30327.1 histidine kinase [Sphingomonas pokkalii]
MGSRGWASLLRGMLLLLAGGAFMAAWSAGMYASALVAVLAALWGLVTGIVEARRPQLAPVAAPLTASDPAHRERRLTALLDLSPAPIVTLDGEGRLYAINRPARRLFGAADLVVDPPPLLVEAIGDAAGRPATVAIGGRSYALTTSDFAHGGAQSRLAALIDIDAELKAAEAATLRDLVQVLSHEIVNALTPIASLSRTAADMLDDANPALPALRDAVGTVARRAAGLQRFGESYRAMARLPVPRLQPVPASELAADLARLFATRWPELPLQVDVHGVPFLRADPDQVSAALWALLQNAAEAVGNDAEGAVSLRIDVAEGQALFRVADNGRGIDAADREAIFRPFFTTKPEGTGVGLALARQIFLAHGGDLRLDGDGTGASFLGRIA